jgi:tripartite-type tricarboxylate transporter receptor subunit TctC
MPYNVTRDFAPITLATSQPQMLIVGTQLPVTTVKDLVALAKSRKGQSQLNYASGGSGAVTHLAGEMFKNATGIEAAHIPYKGGTPAAVVEIMAGQVQFMFSGVSVLLPYVKSGQVKGIAVAAPRRSPLAPHLPTVIESGLPGFTVEVWVGLLAPAKTSPAIIAKLNRETVALLKSAEVRDRLLAVGVEPVGSTPEEFRAYIAKDTDKWQRIIRAANIKED